MGQVYTHAKGEAWKPSRAPSTRSTNPSKSNLTEVDHRLYERRRGCSRGQAQERSPLDLTLHLTLARLDARHSWPNNNENNYAALEGKFHRFRDPFTKSPNVCVIKNVGGQDVWVGERRCERPQAINTSAIFATIQYRRAQPWDWTAA